MNTIESPYTFVTVGFFFYTDHRTDKVLVEFPTQLNAALKGSVHDCGQISFPYFYCLEFFSNAFPMILSYKQDTELKTFCYVNNLRPVSCFRLHCFNIPVKHLLQAVFYYLLIRFKHKYSVPTVCHIHFGSKPRMFLSTFKM